MVLVAILLLAHVARMQNIDRLCTSSLYLSLLQWLLANKILHGKLWLQLLCC
jgi:hypothetical protein